MYSSFKEMIEGEEISKDSDIYYFLLARENKQNRKKRSPSQKLKQKSLKKKEKKKEKHNNYLERHIYYQGEIPGIKLYSKEIDFLISKGIHRCGYLREPHWKDEVYTGLCALTENFDLCQYPRVFLHASRNYCPLETIFHKKACERYQRSLKKSKNKYEKQPFSLEEDEIQVEIKKGAKELPPLTPSISKKLTL